VFSIEPNPESFKILTYNSSNFKNWHVYNFGIGDGASHKFLYYFGQGSAEASIFNENLESDALKKVAVKLIILNEENIKRYKLLRSYDLVKIDVEGAELEVLHSIKHLQFRFLSVEVAIKRERGIKVDDVTRFFLKHTRRKAKLLTIEMVSTNSPAGNAIFALN
jgi:FkbM family methyltransferase